MKMLKKKVPETKVLMVLEGYEKSGTFHAEYNWTATNYGSSRKNNFDIDKHHVRLHANAKNSQYKGALTRSLIILNMI